MLYDQVVSENKYITENTVNHLKQLKTVFLLTKHCHSTSCLLRVLIAYQDVTILLHSAHHKHCNVCHTHSFSHSFQSKKRKFIWENLSVCYIYRHKCLFELQCQIIQLLDYDFSFFSAISSWLCHCNLSISTSQTALPLYRLCPPYPLRHHHLVHLCVSCQTEGV